MGIVMATIVHQNQCARWTIGVGSVGACIFLIVFIASYAVAYNTVSSCVDDCNGCADMTPSRYGVCSGKCTKSNYDNSCVCSCEDSVNVFAGSFIGVAVGFYLFWPFAIAACIGCCCMCCNPESTTVVNETYAQMPGGYPVAPQVAPAYATPMPPK